jgi:hypothetical protein
MVVEDIDFCATTLEIALETIPRVHIRVVQTAQQALEILSAPDAEVSALVTDLHLATMDGFELIGTGSGRAQNEAAADHRNQRRH